MVKDVLNHWKRVKGCQWMTLMKFEPINEARWLSKKNLIDNDGTLTDMLHAFMGKNDLLRHRHQRRVQ